MGFFFDGYEYLLLKCTITSLFKEIEESLEIINLSAHHWLMND